MHTWQSLKWSAATISLGLMAFAMTGCPTRVEVTPQSDARGAGQRSDSEGRNAGADEAPPTDVVQAREVAVDRPRDTPAQEISAVAATPQDDSQPPAASGVSAADSSPPVASQSHPVSRQARNLPRASRRPTPIPRPVSPALIRSSLRLLEKPRRSSPTKTLLIQTQSRWPSPPPLQANPPP